MIELSELTARLASALASCVSRLAIEDATVASATVACSAAASSESDVALLVTPFSASTAWPKMLENGAAVAVADTVELSPLDAAALAMDEAIDGMAGIAGIITTP